MLSRSFFYYSFDRPEGLWSGMHHLVVSISWPTQRGFTQPRCSNGALSSLCAVEPQHMFSLLKNSLWVTINQNIIIWPFYHQNWMTLTGCDSRTWEKQRPCAEKHEGRRISKHSLTLGVIFHGSPDIISEENWCAAAKCLKNTVLISQIKIRLWTTNTTLCGVMPLPWRQLETERLLSMRTSCSALSRQVSSLFAIFGSVGFRQYELTAWAQYICLSGCVCLCLLVVVFFFFWAVSITHSQRGGADTADCELPFHKRVAIPPAWTAAAPARVTPLNTDVHLCRSVYGLWRPHAQLFRPHPGHAGGKKENEMCVFITASIAVNQ